MDWRIKACIQGLLARCPGGPSLNDLLQQAAGGRRDILAHIDSKVRDDWLVHMAALREAGFDLAGRHLMEVGTGWLPVFPLCFSLAGAGRCHTFDLNRHLGASAIRPTLRHLERHLAAIAEASGEPEAAVKARWERLMQTPLDTDILERAGIVYRAPADAGATGLADRSIGLVFSNSVLEHVSPGALRSLMQESHRVLEPTGLTLHSVNCGDHYAYFDRSITPIHYLRYSDKQWRWWNNDLLYQNRLRPVDFIAAARAANLTVKLHWQRPRQDLLARLATLPIAPEFRRYPPEELCSTSFTFAAAPIVASTTGERAASLHTEPGEVIS